MNKTTTKKPSSFEEAVLDQHPSIEMKMNDLAELVAKWRVDPEAVSKVFNKKLKSEMKKLDKNDMSEHILTAFDNEDDHFVGDVADKEKRKKRGSVQRNTMKLMAN